MQFIELQKEDKRWDDYVKNHPDGTIYHTLAWKKIVENSFNKITRYFYVEQDNTLQGIVPLVVFRSSVFGRFVVSFPYVNYGGMLFSNEQAKQQLLQASQTVMSETGSEFVEFRTMRAKQFELPVKSKKVTFYLSLPETEELLMKGFKAKLRSQIRRPVKEGMYAKRLLLDGLDDFYKVFAYKMRELGTPVYAKSFFSNILKTIPEHSQIIAVYNPSHEVVGAAFLIHYKGRLEIPWAATLRAFDRLSPNMLMYFEVMKYGMEKQCTTFDFGRCTKGSGTWRFKKQWGGQEHTLYWYYMMPPGQAMPEVNPENSKYQLAIKAWQKMPLALTKIIGPLLIKHIP